jgi:methionyl-tRNA synthetase
VALVNQYGSDAIRFYFLKEIEFGQDGDYSQTRFVHTVNANLANGLGNLLNRTLKMAHKYFNGCVPNVKSEDIPQEDALKSLGLILANTVTQAYNSLAFSEVCSAIFSLIQAGNKYIDEQAPWSLYKQGKQEAVAQVLYSVLESVRLSSYLLSPIIPNISTRIYQQLGYAIDFNDQTILTTSLSFDTQSVWGALPANQPLEEGQPVFRHLELGDVEEV